MGTWTPSYLGGQYATGGGIRPTALNPTYYATPQTTQQIANLVGGTTGMAGNPSGPGGITLPSASSITVGGQTFDAGVLANLLSRGYSPEAAAQQLYSQSGGAINVSPGQVSNFMTPAGAPTTAGPALQPQAVGAASAAPGGVVTSPRLGFHTTAGTALANPAVTSPYPGFHTTPNWGVMPAQTLPPGGIGAPSTRPGAGAMGTGTQPFGLWSTMNAAANQPAPTNTYNYPTPLNPVSGQPTTAPNAPFGYGPYGAVDPNTGMPVSSPFPGFHTTYNPGASAYQAAYGDPWANYYGPTGGAPAAGAGPAATSTGNPPPTWIQQLAQSGMGGLQGIIQGGGNPINAMPAWQAMIAAQQRNIAENQAMLDEQYGVSGNRFSSAFGTGMTDYMTQTALGQNAMLGQMTMQAQTDAQNRLLSAAGTMGQFGYGAGQTQYQDAYNAALQAAGMSSAAAAQMAQFGYGGAQNLFGGAQQAALGLYGGQNTDTQMALQAALNASTNWGQNLLVGSQLGGQQYQLNQQAISNAYQEFLRTQPAYNPLLGYGYSMNTYYPSPVVPGFAPGWLGSVLGGAGGALGGIAALSDVRMKENIKSIGEIGGVKFYRYNFRGDPTPRYGPMAQELYETMPEAVVPGNETQPWMIRLNTFLDGMERRAA